METQTDMQAVAQRIAGELIAGHRAEGGALADLDTDELIAAVTDELRFYDDDDSDD